MSVLNVERPDFMAEEDIRMFEDSVVRFFEQNAPAERVDKWRKDKVVERAMWTDAAQAGLLGLSTPEEYGGMSPAFLYGAVVIEEQSRLGLSGVGFSLHSDIVAPYILHYGSEALKHKYLPKLVSGEMVSAICAGSRPCSRANAT